MIKRPRTRCVRVGQVKIGSGSAITIQSMTKVPTWDVDRCLGQIRALAAAGCDIVRCAVPTAADTAGFAKLVQKSQVPLVADIHFSPERAIEAIEAGAAKIRLNPGNIKTRADIFRIIDAAKVHKIAIRIGVNEASIRDLKTGDTEPRRRTALMLKEMKSYVRLFEKRGFSSIVLSAKSSDTLRTIEVNRALSESFDYPLHLGLTHAGLPEDARLLSAVALGALLSEGIGDTVRVSAAGDPINEVIIAKEILTTLGLRLRSEPELIVCPTCGRAQIDVVAAASRIRDALKDVHKPLRIAVMGCIVNGPGEAADADFAVCCGNKKAFIYRGGRKIATVSESKIVPAILKEIGKRR
jgi:(E)-4-hydroxy-3-methylbut-2-enyl-diphosphate synthase